MVKQDNQDLQRGKTQFAQAVFIFTGGCYPYKYYNYIGLKLILKMVERQKVMLSLRSDDAPLHKYKRVHLTGVFINVVYHFLYILLLYVHVYTSPGTPEDIYCTH